MTVALPPLWHVGIVVSDMEAAAEDYRRQWGAEAEDLQTMTFDSATYKGTQVAFSANYAFIRTGASEIELIEPREGRSPYSDFLTENGGDGLHHLAYLVDDVGPYLDHLRQVNPDVRVILDSPAPPDGRFVYIEGVAHGPAIELIRLPTVE